MAPIKNENYTTILGFMVNDLHLKGNELLVYAIIYGFSQAEEQVFSGSLQYLADWVGASKQGVSKNLKSLVEKGLIEKRDYMKNGVKFCEYRATKALNKVDGGMKQSLMGYETKFNGGIKQSLPNNKLDNKSNNQLDSMVRPTLEQVKAYCQERRNGVDAERWFNYYSANGWKVGKNPMKDWKAAVRTWERQDKPNTLPRPSNERTYDDDFFKRLENGG